MTDEQIKTYERMLPEMSRIAGLIILPLPDDPLFSTADFDPRFDGGDCLKLICGMRSAVYKTGRRVELYGGSASVSCRIANNAAVEIEGTADRDQDAICLCAMAWIEEEK